MISDLSTLCVRSDSSIRRVIACIDRNDARIALVVDEEYRLLATITDGDVRRAMLAGVDLDAPIGVIRDRKADSLYPRPVTAPFGTEPAALLRLMQERQVRQVPLLDQAQRVVGLVTLRELLPDVLPLQAAVVAGGYGTRLRPFTEQLPKSMLPIGDRPLLELIIRQLREVGIKQVNLMTHYKSEVITQHFGDGRNFGVEIRYVEEDRPLGTAGALSLLDGSDEPLLVINGDILTRLDFRAMLDFHREHQADMTVAVQRYEFRVPYGVIETDGVRIRKISEKPVVPHFINAGIYLLNSEARRFIPDGQTYDMPDLMNRLIAEERRVVSFPVREYWLDIGQIEDYQRALTDVKSGKV